MICYAVGRGGVWAPLQGVPKGQTVNSEYHMNTLKETVPPWANKRYCVQDNAPCDAEDRFLDDPKINCWHKGVWPPISRPECLGLCYGRVSPKSNQ